MMSQRDTPSGTENMTMYETATRNEQEDQRG
jgi:hypothetical protein